MKKSYFITGTDTGVGKTMVTALLALSLQERGIDVGIMKPIASGCERHGDMLVNEDAAWLRQVTGSSDEFDLINPVRFEEPLAPLVAARRAGEHGVDYLGKVMAAFRILQRRHEVVLVEGVGGLLVPLQDTEGAPLTCVDLANRLELPVIVVARRMLGTINHTLLTCQVALSPPAHFAGIVFCDSNTVDEGDVAAQTSPDIIAEMTKLPVLGTVPRLAQLDLETLRNAARNSFHLV